MKRSILLAALTIAALSAPAAFAQDSKPAPAKPAIGMGMDKDQHAAPMQEKMKTMQGQMDKIRQTTDPKERQKLMQEHMQAMQATMEMMRGMGGSMMMSGKKHGMTDGDMMNRHEMTEKRMDMMQMMMEQMIQRDQATESMPPK